MAYYCENCDSYFQTPHLVKTRYGLGGKRVQRLYCCPHCRVAGMFREMPYAAD